MDSLTKTKLTDAQLRAAVRAQFGRDVTIVSATELTAGWYNTVYEMTLSDERHVALKVAPPPVVKPMRCEKGLMKTEVEVLQRAAATGLPVPEVYAYDATRSLFESEYFFMSSVTGQPYIQVKTTMPTSERDAVETELGAINRILNRIEGPAFGYYGQDIHRSSSWPNTFYGLLSDVLNDGREIGLALPVSFDEIERRVLDCLPCLAEVTKPSLIHWDLWDGNVFVAGERITGIIDFERALWADPLMEYYFSRHALSPAFVRGYGRSPATPSERCRRALYDLYLDLVLVTECDYRHYDDVNHVQWTKNNFAAGWQAFLSATSGEVF